MVHCISFEHIQPCREQLRMLQLSELLEVPTLGVHRGEGPVQQLLLLILAVDASVLSHVQLYAVGAAKAHPCNRSRLPASHSRDYLRAMPLVDIFVLVELYDSPYAD